jgi:hypothetical protein
MLSAVLHDKSALVYSAAQPRYGGALVIHSPRTTSGLLAPLLAPHSLPHSLTRISLAAWLLNVMSSRFSGLHIASLSSQTARATRVRVLPAGREGGREGGYAGQHHKPHLETCLLRSVTRAWQTGTAHVMVGPT